MSSLKEGERREAASIKVVTKLLFPGLGEGEGSGWSWSGVFWLEIGDEASILSETQMELQID